MCGRKRAREISFHFCSEQTKNFRSSFYEIENKRLNWKSIEWFSVCECAVFFVISIAIVKITSHTKRFVNRFRLTLFCRCSFFGFIFTRLSSNYDRNRWKMELNTVFLFEFDLFVVFSNIAMTNQKWKWNAHRTIFSEFNNKLHRPKMMICFQFIFTVRLNL